MTDIVERLHEAIAEGAGELAERCIVEIERLRKASAEPTPQVSLPGVRELVELHGRAPQVSPWQPIARHLEDFALWLELNGHTVNGHLGRPTSDLHYKCDACRRLTGAREALAALPAPPSVEAIPHEGTK